MAKYAVATINFYDNDLKIEFVEASDLRDAIIRSSFCKDFTEEDFLLLPDTLEEIKGLAFDQDAMIDVKEIT